jgi:membrane fusion protein (multidrug efflux system)
MADQQRVEGSAAAVNRDSKTDGLAAPDHAAIASDHAAGTAVGDSTSAPLSARPAPNRRRRRWLVAVVILLLVVVAYFGTPIVNRALNTVSTDDAYVNGHVTFVAPRVPGQVVNVLVDDNDRVKHGDVLVQLDREPYQVIVDQKQAALDVARSNLNVAKDQVQATVGQARSARFKLEHTIEEVSNQIALLRSNVAAVDTARAKLALAQADYQRAVELQKTPGAIAQQDVDTRRAALRTAEAVVQQTLQQVYQIRASLGLSMQPAEGHELAEVPPNLDQTFSSVRAAMFEMLQAIAPLGVAPKSYNSTPKEVIAEFLARSSTGNLNEIYDKLIQNAPAIEYAKSQVMVAQADLDQAKLNLSYCDVLAEIDGQVTRRNVNKGNNVAAGQSLMAVRSLTEIWVDANFKETQLAAIRIGQPVDLDVDMYGSHKMFKGRVEGFSMGTGSTLALLPAENATGNFVKVVQRLPVRIVLLDYDPEKVPLFVGLSVTPYVYIHAEPTGLNADEVLRPVLQLPEKPLDPKLRK